MPGHYGSVLAEHRAVRTSAGIFDVSHLGRFRVAGEGSTQALRRLLSNDVTTVEPGRTQYTLMLDQSGGIIDDLLVWRWENDVYWVLPNAANHLEVVAAVAEAAPAAEVVDLRPTTAMLAIQGPDAPGIISEVMGTAPHRFRTEVAIWDQVTVHLGGTGYTGERGGEACLEANAASLLFAALSKAGALPCGLAARDTLRLETGLPLWGQDIDRSTSPLEAGLDFAVAWDHDFTGRRALERQQREGLDRRLVGFVVDGRGIPRPGHRLRWAQGLGEVTSGNISPLLNRGVGLGYLSPPPTVDGEGELEVEIRGNWIAAHLARPPFHR